MLDFDEYGDFADYFGRRWNFLLKNAIAYIPIPFRFGKGEFGSGFAQAVLAEYARRPEVLLDEREKEKLADASRELWRRFEKALEENSEARWKLMALRPGDNVGDRSLTADDSQEELLSPSGDPF